MGTTKKRLLKEIRRASTLLQVYLQPTKVRVTGKEILDMQMAETANRTVKSQTEIAAGIQDRMSRFSI